MSWLVDCGNTRIKWGRAGKAEVIESGSIVHAGRQTDATAELAALIASAPAIDRDSVWVASVLDPNITRRLVAQLRGIVGDVRLVEPTASAHGLKIGYEDPSRLGVDRWLAMVAGCNRVSGAVCIVNAGTAVTFDAVDSTGTHLGGFIWPGRSMMASALAEGTGRIGRTRLEPDAVSRNPLGLTTDAAVANGSILAVAAAVDRAVRIAATVAQEQPAVLIGGGDANLVRSWLESPAEVQPDIVLEGLRIVATASG